MWYSIYLMIFKFFKWYQYIKVNRNSKLNIMLNCQFALVPLYFTVEREFWKMAFELKIATTAALTLYGIYKISKYYSRDEKEELRWQQNFGTNKHWNIVGNGWTKDDTLLFRCPTIFENISRKMTQLISRSSGLVEKANRPWFGICLKLKTRLTMATKIFLRLDLPIPRGSPLLIISEESTYGICLVSEVW